MLYSHKQVVILPIFPGATALILFNGVYSALSMPDSARFRDFRPSCEYPKDKWNNDFGDHCQFVDLSGPNAGASS